MTKPKKRWRPNVGQIFWWMDNMGNLFSTEWPRDGFRSARRTFGVYKTEAEALAMRDKILKFVESEIGSV